MSNIINLRNETLAYCGDASMLLCPLTAYLSSHREPDGVAAAVSRWVASLDAANACVMVGNLTSGERHALRLLAERGIPVVLALATSLPDCVEDLRLDAAVLAAYNAGRMVIVSPMVEGVVSEATAQTSSARNTLMIGLAEHVVVGFMSENGNLQRQLLGRNDVEILKADGHDQVQETDEQRLRYNATQMGWSIYNRLNAGVVEEQGQAMPISSLEVRKLLAQYLKIEGIERPSLLHSLMLLVVLRKYASLPDFDFTAFFRLWNPESLRPEDLRATRIDGHWVPSLAERTLARLFKALPSKLHPTINPAERFDAAMAHQLLDPMLQRSTKPNKHLLQRALSLAYFEHNSAAIAGFRKLLGK